MLLLLEYAGFLFDIENKFPSESHRKEFERQFILQAIAEQGQESNNISEEFLNGFDVSFLIVFVVYFYNFSYI